MFLFDYIPGNLSLDNVRRYTKELEDKLSDATDEYRMVVNGPSWLIAYAGYVWLNNEHRTTLGMLVFDNTSHTYKETPLGYN